jgi:hypothetical protein
MAERLDPLITAAVRRLAGNGVPAAEARRAVGPLAESLGRPRPSYSAVLRLVRSERARRERLRDLPSLGVPLLQGRWPTWHELDEAHARALEHK